MMRMRGTEAKGMASLLKLLVKDLSREFASSSLPPEARGRRLTQTELGTGTSRPRLRI